VIKTSWSKISLTFFFVIAIFGSILRMIPFIDIKFNYIHLLHSHSHIAFQGWVYTVLFLLIVKLFLDDDLIAKGKFKLQFVLTLIVLLGIMFAFALQGYAFFSILFSSFFQLLNYWFFYSFLKNIKKSKKATPYSFSLKFIKIGFWMMLFSTIGPLVVGILSAKGLKGSELYNAALYFFLHFQYNGWFTFAILGIFFFLLEKYNFSFKIKEANSFYLLFSLAVIPSYFLSLLGMSMRYYIIIFCYISVSLQIISLIFLVKCLKGNFIYMKEQINYWEYLLFKISAYIFILKIILQFASVLPFFKELAFYNHFIVMAYIHAVMIGFISFFLIASLFQLRWLSLAYLSSKIGVFLLVSGFIVSEIILVLMGMGIIFNNNQLFLFVFSSFIAFGTLLIIIMQFTNNSKVCLQNK
jgi:hypothetical protein